MKYSVSRKKTREYLPVYIALIGMLLIFLGSPWSISALVSLGTWIIILSAFLSIIPSLMRKRVSRETVLFLVIVCLSVIFVAFSGSFSYEAMVSLFGFVELPCFMLYFGLIKTSQSRQLKTVIYWIFWVVSLYLFIVSLTGVAYQYKHSYGISIIEDLTLGFSNPNQTGMSLMIIVFILVNAIGFFPSRKVKLMYAVMAVISTYLLFQTKSRICILLLAVFFIYVLFSLYRFVKLNRFIYKFALFFPALFVCFTLIFEKMYKNLMILGDSFETGRLALYQDVFENLSFASIVCGDFQAYPLTNLHNTYVSIFASLGIFVLVAFVMLLGRLLSNYFGKIQSRNQKLAFFSIVLVVLHSAVESAFFVSGSYYAVMVFALICLLLNDGNVKGKVR